MPTRKIIIVGSNALGRTGTSAMMGLVRLFGANVGGKKTGLGRKSNTNRKGHLEIPSYKNFLGQVLPKFYPTIDKIPSPLDINKKINPDVQKQFRKLILSEFGRNYPIVLKDARLMALYFFKHMKDVDIKCIVMERNLEDQVRSTIKKNHRKQTEKNQRYFRKKILAWRKFVEQTGATHTECTEFALVLFEQLIGEPVYVANSLADWLEMPRASEERVKQWLDPSLTHIGK